MSRTYVNGAVHVRQSMCATCIGHPDNRMGLEPGRVEGMVAAATADDSGSIPCHSHLYRGERIEPVCRWFYDHHATRALRMAAWLDMVVFVRGADDG